MKKGTRKKIVRRKTVKKKIVSKRRATPPKKTSRAPKKAILAKGTVSLEAIGKVTHFFPKVKAGVVKITKGTLAVGDTIHIKGHTTDFKQKVNSIQLDRAPLRKAVKGQEIGLRVKSRVRQHDIVYKSA